MFLTNCSAIDDPFKALVAAFVLDLVLSFKKFNTYLDKWSLTFILRCLEVCPIYLQSQKQLNQGSAALCDSWTNFSMKKCSWTALFRKNLWSTFVFFFLEILVISIKFNLK